MTARHIWIIGGSGLLGSALSARFPRAEMFRGAAVPWSDPESATATLTRSLAEFTAALGPQDSWTIFWAAGAGVIGSDASVFERESHVVAGFASALGRQVPRGRGAFFFASSAAVYAGSHPAPFSEATPTAPRSDYAAAKRHQEQIVERELTGRLPHVIGRISTLFGPGQDLTKGQGLVSRMCLQAATRQPVSIFVPLDTLRDYIFVDDAAAVIECFVESARLTGSCTSRTRVVAHGTSQSIAELAAQIRTVSHRRIGMYQAAVAASAAHVRDLRVRTDHADELTSVTWTSVAAGVDAVYRDIEHRVAQGSFSHTLSGRA